MTRLPPAAMDALARCPALGGVALEIGGKLYDVAPLDPGEHRQAYRLARRDARDDGVYDVWLTRDGLTCCSCPHYTMRLAGTQARCKHSDSLIRSGLLPDVIPPAAKRREL